MVGGAVMTIYTWIGWGRPGKCVPIPGEAIGTFECLSCERLITPESNPEEDCPKYRKPLTRTLPVAGE